MAVISLTLSPWDYVVDVDVSDNAIKKNKLISAY